MGMQQAAPGIIRDAESRRPRESELLKPPNTTHTKKKRQAKKVIGTTGQLPQTPRSAESIIRQFLKRRSFQCRSLQCPSRIHRYFRVLQSSLLMRTLKSAQGKSTYHDYQ